MKSVKIYIKDFKLFKMKKNKFFNLCANIVSRIFGFTSVIWMGLVFVFSGKFSEEDYRWILLAVGVFLIAGIFLFILVKLKIIQDIDLTRREERPLLFFVLILLGLGLLFIYINNKVNPLLQYLIVIFLVEMIFNFLITLFWKISNHMLWTTTLVLWAIILLEGGWWFLLLLFLPVVGWARHYLKKHTITQIIMGSLLAFGVVIPLSIIFNLI